jgi:hypothetical protein
MCGIIDSGDFQRVWDGFIVPPFPSDRHFPRFRLRRFWLEVWAIDSSRVLLVAGLLAVVHNLGDAAEVPLRLDDRQCMPQAVVLDDGSVADTLILAKDAVGKRVTLPSHLQWPVCKVVELDILACQLVGCQGS